MRNTSTGLIPNQTLIRVRNAVSRRHAKGVFVEARGNQAWYRSDYNGGVYPTPLSNVKKRKAVRP